MQNFRHALDVDAEVRGAARHRQEDHQSPPKLVANQATRRRYSVTKADGLDSHLGPR